MDLTRRSVLAVAGTSILVAGCVGGDDDADDAGAANDDDPADDDATDDTGDSTDENGNQEDATVQVYSHPEFDEVLVGPEGMTLYNFDADEQGEPESACYDDCADAWPPLTVDDPTAGEGVTAELTTFERDDGTTQVAADGWPLYYFDGDSGPGDAEGQGVNDVWWVLRPDGSPVRDDPSDDDPDGEAVDATVTVGPDGAFEFDPETLEVETGATVEFVWDSGGHDLAVIDQPDEGGWDGVADVQGEGYTHTHTFDVEGQYDYVCTPHRGAGMEGTVLVGDVDPDDGAPADDGDDDDRAGPGY